MVPALRLYSVNAGNRWKKAYIALGSNVGDELAAIDQACDALAAHPAIRLKRTSCLYPTKPMYVADQDEFLNAACEIETCLPPFELLDTLEAIEKQLGRVKTIDKGPRSIDLDILLYEDEIVHSPRLTIPHALMHEREFVLRPLADLIPNTPIPTVHKTRSIKSHLDALTPSVPPMTPMIPFGPAQVLRPLDPHRRTKIMSILNVTPDSFSDGGKHFNHQAQTSDFEVILAELRSATLEAHPITPSTLSTLLALVKTNPYLSHLHSTITAHISSGAQVLDIGGQSSRPNAPSITAAEEYQRLEPALLLQRLFFPSLPTSIDTYRAAVFSAVVSSFPPPQATTADKSVTTPYILNDISAGLLDPPILPLAAAAHATVVLTHTRGTPEDMSSHTSYPAGVVRGVAAELAARVRAAEAAGVRRWRIVLDPGVGFAKTGEGNLELLRGLERLVGSEGLHGVGWLVGSSRKRFIAGLLGRDDAVVRRDVGRLVGGGERDEGGEMRAADGRDWGSAAAAVAAVVGGADVVRVHAVRETRDAVVVADAIYRS